MTRPRPSSPGKLVYWRYPSHGWCLCLPYLLQLPSRILRPSVACRMTTLWEGLGLLTTGVCFLSQCSLGASWNAELTVRGPPKSPSTALTARNVGVSKNISDYNQDYSTQLINFIPTKINSTPHTGTAFIPFKLLSWILITSV